MSFCLILLAAGKSSRFNSNLAKPYHKIAGKTLIEMSLNKSAFFSQIKKTVIVYNIKDKKNLKKLKLKNIKFIKGGKTRQQSTFNALKYLIKQKKISKVLIHDAARPNFTIKLLKNLINSLKKNKASIPVISSKDSIKYKVKNQLFNLDRKNSYLTQTPQAFKFKDIYDLSVNQKNIIQDEATLFLSLIHI